MKKIVLIVITCFFTQVSHSKEGDTIHVLPFNKVLMQTDPTRGVNEILTWVKFPSKQTPYRKITAYITLQCPDGMKCGAWDYLDYVIIRRKGDTLSKPLNLEILRMLTPYGGFFNNEWKFTWQQDITDWGYILHDSLEIEYQHTGYESNDKIGWLVTIDFEIIKGKAIMEPLGYDTLWYASFPYGDTTRPIESLLTAKTITTPKETKIINWRIIQTGHGMDLPDNCSEFCGKWRELMIDNRLLEHKLMTIVCGTNPLYPQAGTWLYSRSNWCPGSLAIPDIYTISTNKSQYTFDLKMEPYISEKPSGGWSINAQAFYYKQPSAKNDVELEAIIAPSKLDPYSRMNPICASPKIVIKNNGSENLTSVVVEYGIKGQKKQKYIWKGSLNFLAKEEITLPGNLNAKTENDIFEVMLSKPNGKSDEYPNDNNQFSTLEITPSYPRKMILALQTNNDTAQTSWFICNAAGDTILKRKAQDLKPATLYTDTLFFEQGCYQLQITDTANDGLSYWANPDGGYGYVRLLDANGRMIINFQSDFGTSIIHSFTTENDAPSIKPQLFFTVSTTTNSMIIADIVLDKQQNIAITFIDSDNNVCWENKLYDFDSNLLKFDITHLKQGVYQVILTLENGEKITKRFRKR